MEKKPFEFPKYEDFAGPWRMMYAINKPSPKSIYRSDEEQSALESHYESWMLRLPKYYALDFLSTLMEHVNDGKQVVYGMVPVRNELSKHEWDYDVLEGTHLLKLNGVDRANEFLNYKGSGTSTIEQLNILFGIK